MQTIRVATWNMKQAVAPRELLPDLWAWLEQTVQPDIAALTEARAHDGRARDWLACAVPAGGHRATAPMGNGAGGPVEHLADAGSRARDAERATVGRGTHRGRRCRDQRLPVGNGRGDVRDHPRC